MSIRVDLVDGGGLSLWPRPGRIFTAARSHSFADLATAIDEAFARWDRAHLHMFDLGESGGLLIDPYWDDPPDDSCVDDTVNLSTLTAAQQFVYVFDLGDNWNTYAPSAPSASTRSTPSASHPTDRCPTGEGATSPTSTAEGGTATTATTARRRRRQTPS